MKKYKVLDLFCGAGGLSLGFKNAGFEIVGGIEWNEAALQTHKLNIKSKYDYCGDITEIRDEYILKTYNNVDVIIGGPPCQGFSGLNRRNKDGDDPRNMLFQQYLRFVGLLKPKIVLIENVKQILTSKNGFVKDEICKVLKELGYNVEYSIVRASLYGVPQDRYRAIFIGVKDLYGKYDFNILKKYEKPLVTVGDAISDIAEIENDVLADLNKKDYYILKETKSNYQKLMRKKSNNKLYNHLMYYPTQNVQKMISYVRPGYNWREVPKELFKSDRDNRQSNYLRRLDYKTQSITIDTGHNMYFHPVFNRVPTIRESARLQSFPDDFIFVGNKGEQFKQVGNAVPPLMAYAIACSLLEVLKNAK